jgi:hypothetical protein
MSDEDAIKKSLDASNRRWAELNERAEDADRAARRLARWLMCGIVVAAVVLPCVFCEWVYGDWKCGLPGIECRKVVP